MGMPRGGSFAILRSYESRLVQELGAELYAGADDKTRLLRYYMELATIEDMERRNRQCREVALVIREHSGCGSGLTASVSGSAKGRNYLDIVLSDGRKSFALDALMDRKGASQKYLEYQMPFRKLFELLAGRLSEEEAAPFRSEWEKTAERLDKAGCDWTDFDRMSEVMRPMRDMVREMSPESDEESGLMRILCDCFFRRPFYNVIFSEDSADVRFVDYLNPDLPKQVLDDSQLGTGLNATKGPYQVRLRFHTSSRRASASSLVVGIYFNFSKEILLKP